MCVIDSQSIRSSTNVPAIDQGIDAGKKIVGRKRSIVIDTVSLLLTVLVTAASVQDSVMRPDAHREGRRRARHQQGVAHGGFGSTCSASRISYTLAEHGIAYGPGHHDRIGIIDRDHQRIRQVP